MCRYCDSQGLATPRGPCDAGYICTGGAYTETPTDGKTGSLCPAGGYCTPGSWQSDPCPPGTYSNTSGAINDKDCRDCDPGYYCANARGPSPDGPCEEGHYCTQNALTARQNIAQPGFFAPKGSSVQTPCQVGTYQPLEAKGSCDPCLPGHYCETTQMSTTKPCPAGSYCPEGSEVPTSCPAGTYNNETNRFKVEHCFACPPGKYCGTNSILPSGNCLQVIILESKICLLYTSPSPRDRG